MTVRALVRRPVGGLPVAIWLAVLAGCLALAGAMWDVAWHRTLGRDTFWSPPHLLLYAGVSAGLLAALVGLAAGNDGAGRHLGRVPRPLGYALALVGNAGVVLTAPVDDLWHRLYGRDVDIWSAPHLLALVASALATIGWIAVVQPWLARAAGRERLVCRAVYTFFLALLLYTAWFGLNWYHMVVATRDTLTYPSLVGLLVLPTLVAASLADRRGWPATAAGLAFMALAALPVVVFGAVGWVPPAWPPLLVGPAFALDALTRGARGRAVSAPLLLGLGVAFAILFLTVEAARAGLLPAAPLVAGRLEGRVLGPYLAAAAAHPWTLPAIARAFPQVLAACLGGAALGGLLARLWVGAHGEAAARPTNARRHRLWARLTTWPRGARGHL
jgi:hypothetical protein